MATSRIRELVSTVRLKDIGLLKRGGAGLALKVVSTFSSLAMFGALARVMSIADFGNLGIAISIAIYASTISDRGQPVALMRFLPIHALESTSVVCRRLLLDTATRAAAGAVVGAALVMLCLLLVPRWGGWGYSVLVGLLIIESVVSDFLAIVIRCAGSVFLAISPKEIFWRLATVCCVYLALFLDFYINASTVLMIMDALLLIVIAGQFRIVQRWWTSHWSNADPSRSLSVEDQRADSSALTLDEHRRNWQSAALGLWGASVSFLTVPNVSMVLVGITLSSDGAALMFFASKIASFLQQPMTAMSFIVPPMIATNYHKGNLRGVERISSLASVSATSLVALGLIALLLFGEMGIEAVNKEYVRSLVPALILGFGVLCNAAVGPTEFVMMMTGHERLFLRYLTISNIVALAGLVFASLQFGIIGAAWAITLCTILWNFWSWRWCRKECGIESSLLGVIPQFRRQ